MSVETEQCAVNGALVLYRDAPAPPPPTFVPAPIQSIGFAQEQPGQFVFGSRAHDSAEPVNNSVAMES